MLGFGALGELALGEFEPSTGLEQEQVIDTPVSDSVILGGGGAFGTIPQSEIDRLIHKYKKKKRKPRTYTIKYGEWPDEPAEVTTDPSLDDAVAFGDSFFDEPSDEINAGADLDDDEAEALQMILALAA